MASAGSVLLIFTTLSTRQLAFAQMFSEQKAGKCGMSDLVGPTVISSWHVMPSTAVIVDVGTIPNKSVNPGPTWKYYVKDSPTTNGKSYMAFCSVALPSNNCDWDALGQIDILNNAATGKLEYTWSACPN